MRMDFQEVLNVWLCGSNLEEKGAYKTNGQTLFAFSQPIAVKTEGNNIIFINTARLSQVMTLLCSTVRTHARAEFGARAIIEVDFGILENLLSETGLIERGTVEFRHFLEGAHPSNIDSLNQKYLQINHSFFSLNCDVRVMIGEMPNALTDERSFVAVENAVRGGKLSGLDKLHHIACPFNYTPYSYRHIVHVMDKVYVERLEGETFPLDESFVGLIDHPLFPRKLELLEYYYVIDLGWNMASLARPKMASIINWRKRGGDESGN